MTALTVNSPGRIRLIRVRLITSQLIMNKLPALTFVAVALGGFTSVHAADVLPSWNDTAPKKAIVAFVEKVTKEGSPDFVPPAERITTFDNDGTLWAEQPIYVQFAFTRDRVKALVPQHPEWKTKPPFSKLISTPKEEMVEINEHDSVIREGQGHNGMSALIDLAAQK